jgi:hypothetical protein
MLDGNAGSSRTADRTFAFDAFRHRRLDSNYSRLRPAHLQADRPLLGRRRLDDLRREDKESAMKILRQLTIVFGPHGPHPSGLDRVVTLTRSRYCELISLEYHAAGVKGADSAVAVATVKGNETRLALLIHNVAALVEVLDLVVVDVDAEQMSVLRQPVGRRLE